MSSTVKISNSTLDTTAFSSSPSSSLVLRLHKPPIGMSMAFNDETASTSSSYPPPSTLLNRSRPARLDIPITNSGFRCDNPVSPAVVVDPVEVEGGVFGVL